METQLTTPFAGDRRRINSRRGLAAHLLAGERRRRTGPFQVKPRRRGALLAATAPLILPAVAFFGVRAAAPPAATTVTCESLLDPAEVAKVCKIQGGVTRPTTASKTPELDMGVCSARFQDRKGHEVRFTLERSSSADENHHAAEETLRAHGADRDFSRAGLAPVVGAAWSSAGASHSAIFLRAWRLDFTAATCAPAALGTLGATAATRLPE